MVPLPTIYFVISVIFFVISLISLIGLHKGDSEELWFIAFLLFFSIGIAFMFKASNLLEMSYKYNLMEDATKIAIGKI